MKMPKYNAQVVKMHFIFVMTKNAKMNPLFVMTLIVFVETNIPIVKMFMLSYCIDST